MASHARISRRLLAKQAQKHREKIPEAIAKLRSDADHSGKMARTIVAGWSFVFDIGMQDDAIRKSPASAAQIMGELYKMSMDECDGTCGTGHTHCHLSARLHPLGRSSSEEDWYNLGYATHLIGMSEAAAEAAVSQVKDEEHIRSRAIHYLWTEALT